MPQQPGGAYGQPVSGGPPGPPSQPASQPSSQAAPKRKRGVGFAIFIAFVAVLLAVVSGGVALWALKKADDAQTKAADAVSKLNAAGPATPAPTAQPTTVPEPTGTTEEAPPPDPVGTSTTAAPLNPNAVFETKYDSIDLTAPLTSSSTIDLDLPRVGDRDEADITLVDSGGGAIRVQFDSGIDITSANSPLTSPKECAEDILYSPLDSSVYQTFRQGTSFCVQTSKSQADKRGETRTMVLVTVKNVSASSAVITAKAWRVPAR